MYWPDLMQSAKHYFSHARFTCSDLQNVCTKSDTLIMAKFSCWLIQKAYYYCDNIIGIWETVIYVLIKIDICAKRGIRKFMIAVGECFVEHTLFIRDAYSSKMPIQQHQKQQQQLLLQYKTHIIHVSCVCICHKSF